MRKNAEKRTNAMTVGAKAKEIFHNQSVGTRSGTNLASITAGLLIAWLAMEGVTRAEPSVSENALVASPGDTTYRIDPTKGDDANPEGHSGPNRPPETVRDCDRRHCGAYREQEPFGLRRRRCGAR